MNILFVHTNFPGQYRRLADWLRQQRSFRLAAIGSATARAIDGINLLRYPSFDGDVSATHPFARRFDLECRRAEQVLYCLSSLHSAGFVPDVVLAHPGWGESLPLRTIFPNSRLLLYCEFFYGVEGRDVGFDLEFPSTGVDGHVGLNIKNAATLLALSECDGGVAPTQWQRSTFPKFFHDLIDVIHEGIDTNVVKPNPNAVFRLRDGRELRFGDEVVTFVARNLEPLRGYHIFMRMLPRILAARPNAQVIIIGGDGSYYGASPPAGKTWREIFLKEVSTQLDQKRVHFTGRIPYEQYLSALQVSAAHVYLTYPFVLSWSLIEALSAGCIIIGSDTAPVREVIDGDNGLLVPFFEVTQLADQVIEVLTYARQFQTIRKRARETALLRFDFESICLPKMLQLIELANSRQITKFARDRFPKEPQIVALAQRKGGSGKTTLAVSVSAELCKRGANLGLVDADPQRSASQWAEMGNLSFPVWEISLDGMSVRDWARTIRQINAEIVVVDTAPNEQTLGAAIALSSVVVIPCMASRLDLESTRRTMELVADVRRRRAKRLSVILVPNRIDLDTLEGQQISEELAQFGETVSPPISDRTAFVRAFITGHAVCDSASGSDADQEIQTLCQIVQNELAAV